jgi:hypothetical protein
VPSKIHIKEAQDLARIYGYDQVIIYARDCESGIEWMTTYGKTKDHCDAAAKIGNFLQTKIMGWTKEVKQSSARGPNLTTDVGS